MKETKVILALLAGAAAGAAIGILFAPQAGAETRDQLSESLDRLGESIKASATEQVDKLVAAFREQVMNPLNEKLKDAAGSEPSDDLEHA